MDALDLKVSRKLQKIMQRLERLVEKETGEQLGLGLVVFPWTQPGEESRIAEYQYISNAPRSHMQEVMRKLVKNWDAGTPDIPPHEKQ